MECDDKCALDGLNRNGFACMPGDEDNCVDGVDSVTGAPCGDGTCVDDMNTITGEVCDGTCIDNANTFTGEVCNCRHFCFGDSCGWDCGKQGSCVDGLMPEGDPCDTRCALDLLDKNGNACVPGEEDTCVDGVDSVTGDPCGDGTCVDGTNTVTGETCDGTCVNNLNTMTGDICNCNHFSFGV